MEVASNTSEYGSRENTNTLGRDMRLKGAKTCCGSVHDFTVSIGGITVSVEIGSAKQFPRRRVHDRSPPTPLASTALINANDTQFPPPASVSTSIEVLTRRSSTHAKLPPESTLDVRLHLSG